METKYLPNLKIHQLSQAQYDREESAGNLDPDALYLTPDHQSEVEDTAHAGCLYRMVNGQVEWVNPPMTLGVEYRTTERWMGNTVYTKLVDCGNAPNAGTKQIEWHPVVANVIRMSARTGSAYVLPFEAFSMRMEAWCSGQHIWIKTTGDLSSHAVHAQFWYTK